MKQVIYKCFAAVRAKTTAVDHVDRGFGGFLFRIYYS